MSNVDSYYFESIRKEEAPTQLPSFETPLFRKTRNNRTENAKYRKDQESNNFKKSNFSYMGDKSEKEASDTHSGTKSANFLV